MGGGQIRLPPGRERGPIGHTLDPSKCLHLPPSLCNAPLIPHHNKFSGPAARQPGQGGWAEGKFGFHLSESGGEAAHLKMDAFVYDRGTQLIYSAMDFSEPCGPHTCLTLFSMDNKGNPHAARVPHGAAQAWQRVYPPPFRRCLL